MFHTLNFRHAYGLDRTSTAVKLRQALNVFRFLLENGGEYPGTTTVARVKWVS